jgi:hypothetical protein
MSYDRLAWSPRLNTSLKRQDWSWAGYCSVSGSASRYHLVPKGTPVLGGGGFREDQASWPPRQEAGGFRIRTGSGVPGSACEIHCVFSRNFLFPPGFSVAHGSGLF